MHPESITIRFHFSRARLVAAIAAVLLLVMPCHAQKALDELRGKLDQIFDAPAWKNAFWGVKIMDLKTSETLYERNAEKGFMPASNMKLFPTATALAVLGPDYRYETRLYACGPVTHGGILRGDVLIVGSGDPSVSGRYATDTPTTMILRGWAEAVRKAGIRRITGAVIGDDDAFADAKLVGSWQLDYYQEWYAAESGGLTVNDNCWDVSVRPGRKPGAPAMIVPALPTRYVTFKNEILTTGPRPKGEGEAAITISRPLDRNEVTLGGYMPLDLKEQHVRGSVVNGTHYCATLLQEELKRQGVRVSGGALDADELTSKAARLLPGRCRLLHTHYSPPLSRIISFINKPSQNFYADQLLKTLGKVLYGTGDFEHGEMAVRDFLTTAGADASMLRMVDGSGLSRHNLVEPRMILALLAFMASRPDFHYFYDSLPVAGVDGTLRTRAKGLAAENNAHAKTGFINRVRALSGYVTSREGRLIAFCMMVNNYTVETKQANAAQDQAASLLAEYTSVAQSH